MVEQRFPKPQVRGSNPLSPEYLYFMRVKGIEPLSSAWKADNLPLIYTRRFEITTNFFSYLKLKDFIILWYALLMKKASKHLLS